ncbi:hypothetical protein M407DRAFT_30269 [Tulasnella calospora MUT 4182]|uniref:SNF2 N-terminal domain-containing protein n=1 Tax=Tulasnella calospora MUT 4182 TaxID=1051891 RepID=A0A0C3LF44_9AGAM|nr:hypothetical protein M407DRAFT_30269 [Tulasnella calospora MUT 4182]
MSWWPFSWFSGADHLPQSDASARSTPPRQSPRIVCDPSESIKVGRQTAEPPQHFRSPLPPTTPSFPKAADLRRRETPGSPSSTTSSPVIHTSRRRVPESATPARVKAPLKWEEATNSSGSLPTTKSDTSLEDFEKAINSATMGLGKTVELICRIVDSKVYQKETGVTCIVSASGVMDQWKEEIKKFMPSLRVLLHRSSRRAKDPKAFKSYDVVIVSYKTLWSEWTRQGSVPSALMRFGFLRVVLGGSLESVRCTKYPQIRRAKHLFGRISPNTYIISFTVFLLDPISLRHKMTIATRAQLKARNEGGNRGNTAREDIQQQPSVTPSRSASPPTPASVTNEAGNEQPPQSPSATSDQTSRTSSEASESGDEEEDESTERGRGRGWLPWHDRLLITEANALRPFQAAHGSRKAAWEELSTVLKAKSKGRINRAAKACQIRFSVLIKAHRANETRSLQATGKNEEIDDHIQSLTEIVQLLDDAKLESERASSSAKAKVETERRVGLEMREAAMKNLVQARELKEDLGAIEGSSYRERQGQRKRKSDSADLDHAGSEQENHPGPSGPYKKRQTLKAKVGDIIERFENANSQILEEARERDEKREQREEQRHDAVIDHLGRVSTSLDRLANVLGEQRADRQLLLDVVNTAISKRT